MAQKSHYVVAIIGGGISGSEAALQLSLRGISSILFEQYPLPYGKIEEGLPKCTLNSGIRKKKKSMRNSNVPIYICTKHQIRQRYFSEGNIRLGVNATLLTIGAGKRSPSSIDGY